MMIKQQIKHFRLGLGILFLTLSGYYLPTYLQPKTVLAQPTANQNLGQNIEADLLFQEAEQLVNNETQFINALTKYKQALRIYRQISDNQKAIATQQRLETVLAASLPLAEKFEQEMDQDEAAFLAQFPKTENNQTANQLEELVRGQLGIGLVSRPRDSWTSSESQQKAFQDIKEELSNYLDTQGRNPSGSFFEVPLKLRNYLDQNADKLKTIRTLILNNESPRWATDMSWISQGNPLSYASYLGLVDLQNLFAIDIIYKKEQGKTEEIQEILEASWKLNQSFKNDPMLIGQLVNIITIRTQIGVMRKLHGLPTAWQQRLLEHDYRQSMVQTLTGELLHSRAVYRRLMNKPETALEDSNEYFSEDFATEYLELGWSEWSTSLRQNVLRWQAIATYQSDTDRYKAATQGNACLTETPSPSSFLARAGRIMVDLELTQKILQMKEVGSSPQSIPNAPSTICPNASWVYQFTPNERRSITLAPLPWWAADVRGLPLIHTIDLNRN
jgi:tetratricopeptide (TPR) repeat protein